jgi:hypothetical protein
MRNLVLRVTLLSIMVLLLTAVYSDGNAGDKPDISVSFPLLKVAGAGSADVAALIGEPKAWEKTTDGPKAIYLDGAVEIVFIKDRADWITVYPPKPGIRFQARDVTSYLGINKKDPHFANKFTMRWNRTDGLVEVSAFPASKNGEMVEYLYILARTEQ